MIVSITSIRLRSLWKFFSLSWHGLQISRQTRNQKGFLKLRNTGFGYMHYTLTLWETPEDLKAFARSGAHLESMKKSAELATEIRIWSYPAEKLPSWAEARKILHENGKVFRYGPQARN